MPKIKLREIPKPEEGTRTVLVYSGDGTVAMSGVATGHDYVCGVCDSVILEAIPKGQVVNVVFRCNNCGAFNDTD